MLGSYLQRAGRRRVPVEERGSVREAGGLQVYLHALHRRCDRPGTEGIPVGQ